jgi:hypothetical protein
LNKQAFFKQNMKNVSIVNLRGMLASICVGRN